MNDPGDEDCGCRGRRGSRVVGAAKLLAAEIGLAILKDEAVVAGRRHACEACDRWHHGRCLECSCYTWAKTRMAAERCPLDRWPVDTAGLPTSSQSVPNGLQTADPVTLSQDASGMVVGVPDGERVDSGGGDSRA